MAAVVTTFASSRKHSRALTASLIAIDIFFLTLGTLASTRRDDIPSWTLIVAALAALWSLTMSGTYRRSFGGSMRDEWYEVGAALGVVVVPFVALTFTVPALHAGRLSVAELAAVAFIGISASRTLVHRYRAPRRLAIVGQPEHIEAALAHLRPRPDDALLRLPLGAFENDGDDPGEPGWLQSAIDWRASRVIVTEDVPQLALPRVVGIAARHNVSIELVPPRLAPRGCDMRLEWEGDLTLLCARPLPICTPVAQAYKRFVDIALTLPVLVAFAPIMALCAIAIKVDSPGPIIYRQTRVGRHGVPFEMFKFRSMFVDAESRTGPIWADPAMPRATRVGRLLRRTSLDEMPQLVNVLRGEMSLVGPRPERPHFVERFRRVLPRYDERVLVAPGITGWSQISMSRILATDDVPLKLQGDLFYLAEWSPLLDAQILVKTAFEVLFHRVA